MNIDEFDIKIIKFLYSLEKSKGNKKSCEITKIIFPENTNDYELRKKESFIKNRLNKLSSYGVIIKNDEKPLYALNLSKCSIKEDCLLFQYSPSLAILINLNEVNLIT